MQFWTKLVKNYADWRLRLSQAGGLVMLFSAGVALTLEKAGLSDDLAWVVALAGLAMAIIGWMWRGFKTPRPVITEVDIIVSADEIRVGEQVFPMEKIEYLDFLVNNYRGMPVLRRGRVALITGKMRGTDRYGCDNKLMFTLDGKKYNFNFHLEDEMAMRRLGMLFREFYDRRLRFRERNRGGRTFLFRQVVDRRAFERAKASEGYE